MSEVKQVIVFRHDLLKSLRKGKIAAQVAHASLGALLKHSDRYWDEEIKNTTVEFTYDESKLKEAKFHIVAVPTPIILPVPIVDANAVVNAPN